jgi:hypothetical protein
MHSSTAGKLGPRDGHMRLEESKWFQNFLGDHVSSQWHNMAQRGCSYRLSPLYLLTLTQWVGLWVPCGFVTLCVGYLSQVDPQK